MYDVFTGYSISQNEQITGVTARVSGDENTVSTNHSTAITAIGDIDTKDTQQDTRLTNLENRKDTLNSQQATLVSDTATLTGIKNGLRTDMNGIKSRYDTLQTQSTAIGSGLSTIESTITQKLLDIASKADQSELDSFQAELSQDNSTLVSALADRILATTQTSVDATQGARDKFFEERFFAIEEFIRATLATYEVKIKNSAGVFIKLYEYTGVVQNLTNL